MPARRKLLLAVTTGAALCAIGAWTAASRLDATRVRAAFEEAVARETGGSLRTTGAIELRLGLPPILVAEDLALATGYATARIARSELEMSILSLIFPGPARIRGVHLHGLDVTLAPPSPAQPDAGGDRAPPVPPRAGTGGFVDRLLLSDVRVRPAPAAAEDESLPFATIERAAVTTTRDGRSTLRGRGTIGERSVELRGSVGPLTARTDPDARIAFDLAGSIEAIGELTARGEFTPRDGDTPPRIEARIQAKHLDLPGPFLSPGEGARQRLFHDEPFPALALAGASARIELSSATLRIGRARLRDVAFVAELEDGEVRVDPLQARIGGGEISGTAAIDGTRSPPGVSLRLSGRGVALSGIVDGSGSQELLRAGRSRFEVDLRARGASPAAIASTLSGDVRWLVGETRARTSAFDRLTLGPRKIVGKLTGETRRWTRVDCAAVKLTIDEGSVTPEVLLVDTPRTTLVGSGRIDLATESIALEIAPIAKLSDPGITVPVRVLGPLSRPSIDADEVGAARTLGGLLQVAEFPRRAVAGLEGLAGERNVCVDLAAGREPIGPSGLLSETRAVGESIADEIADGARKLRDGVGGLFD